VVLLRAGAALISRTQAEVRCLGAGAALISRAQAEVRCLGLVLMIER
jgi:hypothetical protein